MKDRQRARQILYFIYVQAVFLVLTYVVGVWLATEVRGATIATPELIVHGVLASALALCSAIVGFLAILQNQKRIGYSNLALFFITVASGATGFAFLGNNSSSDQILITNLTMISTIGVAMPITGYSLAKITKSAKASRTDERNPPSIIMAYLALVALSFTIIAGTAVETISLYAFAVVLHVGLAALTVALVLGMVVLSVLEGSALNNSESRSWVPQRVVYSLLGLAAISIAGGDGVITVTVGGVSYVVIMAELTVLVYSFLLLTIEAPIHLNLAFLQHVASTISPKHREGQSQS
ncbi:MAG: hypothetical protein OK457_02205 [Thaumarchaeota archaeon]|nr:hypothetical protein [Nitrososphaerota archaeon]